MCSERPFLPELSPVSQTHQRIPDIWPPTNFRVGIDRSRDVECHAPDSTLQAPVRQKLITALQLTVHHRHADIHLGVGMVRGYRGPEEIALCRPSALEYVETRRSSPVERARCRSG